MPQKTTTLPPIPPEIYRELQTFLVAKANGAAVLDVAKGRVVSMRLFRGRVPSSMLSGTAERVTPTLVQLRESLAAVAGKVNAAENAPPFPVEELVALVEARWADRAVTPRPKPAIAVGIRFAVFVRDRFRCVYCGASASAGATLHADHVLPRSKGGEATLDNLVTACQDCNLGKGSKLLPNRQ